MSTTAHWFGDSWTLGQGVTGAQRFSTLVSQFEGWTEDNQGVSGSQIADAGQTDLITATTIADGDVTVWETGYNDMRYFGPDAGALSDNLVSLLSNSAWCATPTASRINSSDSSVTYTGTWTNLALLGGLNYSSSAGATASFTASGNSIIIGTARATTGGDLNVTVDGLSVPVFHSLRAGAATDAGRAYSTGAICIFGLSSGSHNVVLTAASSANTFFCWYVSLVGSPYSAKVFLPGTPVMPAAGYPANPPFNNGSDSAALSYSGLMTTVATSLRACGLKVYARRILINTSTEYQSDNTHPNVAGHSDIATQLETFIANPIISPTGMLVCNLGRRGLTCSILP